MSFLRKNILLIISLVLLLAMIFSSCARLQILLPNNDTERETETETDIGTETDMESNSESGSESENIWIPCAPYKYNTVYVDGGNVSINQPFSTEFSDQKYADTSAMRNITLVIRGKRYSLIYDHSRKLAYSDITAHCYFIDGIDTANVWVNAKDGSIVRWFGIPYSEILLREEDYINFISDMVDDRIDITECSNSCYTNIEAVKDNGSISRSSENGFYIAGENETVEYNFRFSKELGGVRTNDEVTACFYDGKFDIFITDHKYNERIFTPIVENIDRFEEYIYSFIESNLSSKVVFVSATMGSPMLFVKDGAVCIAVASSVCTKNLENNMVLDGAVITVTRIEPNTDL